MYALCRRRNVLRGKLFLSPVPDSASDHKTLYRPNCAAYKATNKTSLCAAHGGTNPYSDRLPDPETLFLADR
jgi:hypothetical protein